MQDVKLLTQWLRPLSGTKFIAVFVCSLALLTVLFGVGLLSLSGWLITASAVMMTLEVYAPGAGIRFFAVGRTVSRYCERLFSHDLVLSLQAAWREQFFAGLNLASFQSKATVRLSEKVQQYVGDIATMDNLYLRIFMPVVTSLGVSVVLAIFWQFYTAILAAALFVAAVITLVTVIRMVRMQRVLAIKLLHYRYKHRHLAMNITAAMTELVVWDHEENACKQIMQLSEQITAIEKRYFQHTSFAQTIVNMAGQGLFVFTFTYTLLVLTASPAEAAQAIMLTLSTLVWAEVIAELPGQLAQYGKTLAAARRLNSRVGDNMPESEFYVKGNNQNLQLTGVSAFQSHRRILNKVNAVFEPDNIYWIQGESGRGKSTLASVIAGVHPLSAGYITLPETTDNTTVTYLTQHSDFLDASLRDNLDPANRYSDAELISVLELVELSFLLKTLPEGLNCQPEEAGILLSGGQKRRLALARVLLQQRPICILDEPFTGIETALARRIYSNIKPLYESRILIVISHTVPVDDADVAKLTFNRLAGQT